MDSQKNSPSSSFHLSAPSSLSAPRERHMKRLKYRRKRLDVYTSHAEDTCLSCLVLYVFLPPPITSCQGTVSFTSLMLFFFLILKHCAPRGGKEAGKPHHEQSMSSFYYWTTLALSTSLCSFLSLSVSCNFPTELKYWLRVASPQCLLKASCWVHWLSSSHELL